MMEALETQISPELYKPIVADRAVLRSLKKEEVFVVDYTHIHPKFPKKYFKNMVPDVAIHLDNKSGKFFLEDEYLHSNAVSPDFPYGKIP